MLRKPFLIVIAALALVPLACGVSAGRPNPAESRSEAAETGQISGEAVFQSSGCAGCHNGPAGIAPSLAGVFGEEVPLADGETVIADEEYLRESILTPNARVVRGYEPIMPGFDGKLTDAQLDALIEYIRTLGE